MTVTIWYHVRDLDAATRFYGGTLGFRVDYLDAGERWARLSRDGVEIALAEGEPQADGQVATIDVGDVKEEAERLRGLGADVGVVFELHGEMRLVDVFDPDGNRLQLAQELRPGT